MFLIYFNDRSFIVQEEDEWTAIQLVLAEIFPNKKLTPVHDKRNCDWRLETSDKLDVYYIGGERITEV